MLLDENSLGAEERVADAADDLVTDAPVRYGDRRVQSAVNDALVAVLRWERLTALREARAARLGKFAEELLTDLDVLVCRRKTPKTLGPTKLIEDSELLLILIIAATRIARERIVGRASTESLVASVLPSVREDDSSDAVQEDL